MKHAIEVNHMLTADQFTASGNAISLQAAWPGRLIHARAGVIDVVQPDQPQALSFHHGKDGNLSRSLEIADFAANQSRARGSFTPA